MAHYISFRQRCQEEISLIFRLSPLIFRSWILPHHRGDLPQDLGVGAVDGLIGIVLRQQPHMAVLHGKALHRGLVLKQRHHDLPHTGRLLLPDATKVKKNTYTVKLSLHLENQADNEKDKTVSVKVKVK